MTLPAPEDQMWIIEPLLQAGLDLQGVRDLVERLAFECVIGGSAADVLTLVADQPAEVQAAWWHVVGRMLAVDGERS